MEHHRCNKCRNPIRAFAVPCPSATGCDWYHPDCWADQRASEQREYEEKVRSAGLPALLAPYVTRVPVPS